MNERMIGKPFEGYTIKSDLPEVRVGKAVDYRNFNGGPEGVVFGVAGGYSVPNVDAFVNGGLVEKVPDNLKGKMTIGILAVDSGVNKFGLTLYVPLYFYSSYDGTNYAVQLRYIDILSGSEKTVGNGTDADLNIAVAKAFIDSKLKPFVVAFKPYIGLYPGAMSPLVLQDENVQQGPLVKTDVPDTSAGVLLSLPQYPGADGLVDIINTLVDDDAKKYDLMNPVYVDAHPVQTVDISATEKLGFLKLFLTDSNASGTERVIVGVNKYYGGVVIRL